MPIHNKLPDDLHEVDVIISGGGSAGCVIASRLADADPHLVILLVEQGLNNYQLPEVVHPALFPQNLLVDKSRTALFWQGNHAPQLAGRSPVVPSGGTLGGGSSINWMVYTRAQRSDFNSWAAPGWSAEELWPFLKKFETYHGGGDAAHHGADGPIHISSGTFRAKRAENAFIDAASQVGYPELKDLQNLDANNGVERWLRYVGPDGRRQDAAHRYLHPRLQKQQDGGRLAYPNLHVLVENQTVRVLFGEGDDKRAVGIEYRPNPRFNKEAAADGAVHTVGARRLVVLSSGANGTPLILERSGVGAKAVLDRAGVPVVEDLPGVGHDYQDHHLSLWTYRTSLTPDETINGFANGRFDLAAMVKQGHALLGWNSMDASGKFRPTEADVAALGPAFKEAWDRDFKNALDRPLMIIALYLVYLGDHAALPDDAEYVSIANWTAYPYSRGHIHITGPDPADPIDFDVGYLTDEGDVDVKKHIWAYKKARELCRRMSIYRGELPSGHPRFPAGSRAAAQPVADGPVPADAPPIEYTAEDDRAIEQAIRETVGTTWHSLGTAKMAPRDKMGVVDPNLNVYGVKGLKVADLSIPPENVGANTNNTALMIGEKAADIIARELGLIATK